MTQAAVGSNVVVVLPPAGEDLSGVVQVQEPVLRQALTIAGRWSEEEPSSGACWRDACNLRESGRSWFRVSSPSQTRSLGAFKKLDSGLKRTLQGALERGEQALGVPGRSQEMGGRC